jgi:hypothetical protein
VPIVRFLQEAVKSILILSGLVVGIEVSFEPAIVERRSAVECAVTVRLKEAVTPEIAEMMRHSTLVVVSYTMTLYTERDTMIPMDAVKSAYYKSINGMYSVDSDGAGFSTASFSEAVEEVSTAAFVFDPSGVRFAVVKAFLDIPDIRDKNAVKSLWGDKAPTMVVELASDK